MRPLPPSRPTRRRRSDAASRRRSAGRGPLRAAATDRRPGPPAGMPARGAAGARPRAPRRRARPGQDRHRSKRWPRSSAARFGRVQFTPDLVPVGPDRHAHLHRRRPAASSPSSARSSPTCCSPTRSTARPPRCSPRCWRSCRSTRSPSAKRRSASRSHSWCSPRRTRSSPTEPTRCPEAQLDRFMFKVLVDYPSYDDELVVVQRVTGPSIELRTGAHAGRSARRCSSVSIASTSTRAWSPTPRRWCDATRQPAAHKLDSTCRRDPVRRQPARLDQPDRRRPRARVRARSLVRPGHATLPTSRPRCCAIDSSSRTRALRAE